MTSNERDSPHLGESPSPANAGQVAFRREHDRVVVSNSRLSIAFSASDGGIISLYDRRAQTELVDWAEAMSEGVLWRLRLSLEGSASATVTSRSSSGFGHAVESDSEGRLYLQLRWSGLQIGAESVEAQVVVAAVFSADTSTAWLSISIQLPAHLSMDSLDFPCLCALGAADLLASESLFLPLSGGLVISEPRAALAARGEEHAWGAAYPGPASMQMLGFCVGDRTAAWLAAGDSSGSAKILMVSRMTQSNRLSLWFTQHPVRDAESRWSLGFPMCLGLTAGDWFEAARAYRAWAIEQPWSSRGRGGERGLPPLTASSGLWLAHWGGSKHAVAAARELQRAVNVPIKLDWHCWHRCPRGGAYPDYFPPRDGDEVFADARRELAESGVLTQLSFNGLLASQSSETWQAEQASAYAVSDSLSPSSQLVTMCPGTRYWRKKLAMLARQAAQRGADGVFLGDLVGCEPRRCQSETHGHGPFNPDFWAASVRKVLTQVKQAMGRGLNLSADGLNEAYLDLVDAFFSSHPAAEREGRYFALFGNRWSPIPLFPSVYHGHTTLVGPGSSLINLRPHDPSDLTGGGDLHLPTQVMTRDYQAQFYLEIARSAIWGHQILLANFSPEQASGESSRRKLAFLSTVLRAQAWGVGALLPYSEFMGPLRVDAPSLEADLLVNPPNSAPSERRTIKRAIPPVMGSAWRTPGGSVALMLVNIHDQPVEFSARLRSSRLGFSLPIQLIGQTFSEDGDMPAARLRASGSEISGRLPTRSVLLLSLR